MGLHCKKLPWGLRVNLTQQDVLDQLKNLNCNKAYGPDGFSKKKPNKLCLPAIVETLTKLFKYLLAICYFSLVWTSANVLPLKKR